MLQTTSAINKHLEDTDRRVQKQWDQSSANANAIAGMEGEGRTLAAVLGLLQAGGIFISVKGKKAA